MKNFLESLIFFIDLFHRRNEDGHRTSQESFSHTSKIILNKIFHSNRQVYIL